MIFFIVIHKEDQTVQRLRKSPGLKTLKAIEDGRVDVIRVDTDTKQACQINHFGKTGSRLDLRIIMEELGDDFTKLSGDGQGFKALPPDDTTE